jgi:hypothetical protein
MKSSVDVAADVTGALPSTAGVPRLQPSAPTWWPGKSTWTGVVFRGEPDDVQSLKMIFVQRQLRYK